MEHEALRNAVLQAADSANVIVRVTEPVRRPGGKFRIKVMLDILAGKLEPPWVKLKRLREAIERALPDVELTDESLEGIVQGFSVTYDPD